jgi:general transcription factor 3C polypeptide 3 (transcription factor C subunit 4)
LSVLLVINHHIFSIIVVHLDAGMCTQIVLAKPSIHRELLHSKSNDPRIELRHSPAMDDDDGAPRARKPVLRVHTSRPSSSPFTTGRGDDSSDDGDGEENEDEDEESSDDDAHKTATFDGLELLRHGRIAHEVVAYERASTSGARGASDGIAPGVSGTRGDAKEMLRELELAKRNPTMAAFLRMGGAQDEIGKRRRGKGRRRRSAKSRNTMEVDALMSDATILYARGEFSSAVEKLHACIVKAPNSSEPYEQLALVYEETNALDKALDCYSLATVLKRSVDPSMWYRMAALAVQVGNKEYAIHCLAKASRSDPYNFENKIDQATLYAEIGENKKAIEQLEWVLKDDTPSTDGAIIRDATVMLAKMYYNAKMRDKAEYALERMLDRYPQHVDATVVNILIELKIEFRKHAEVLNIVERAYLNIAGDNGRFPLDISVKLGQCLLQVGRIEDGVRHIDELIDQDASEYDDLFLDCASTCVEVGLLQKAEQLYRALLPLEEYNNPDLWQRLEKCISQNRGMHGVADFYEDLYEAYPDDAFVAVSLADALSKFPEDVETIARARALMYDLDRDQVREYGIVLRVTALQRKLLTEDELTVIIPATLTLLDDLMAKREQRKLHRKGGAEAAAASFIDDHVRISDEDIFASIINGAEVALRLGKINDANVIVNNALSFSSGSILTKEQTASLRYLRALVSYMNGDLHDAATNCRNVLEVFPQSITLWNMLMHMAVNYPRALSVGAAKLAKRLVVSTSEDDGRKRLVPLMASGYVHTWNKKWSIAMHDFLTALAIAPNDPEVTLAAAISLLHMSTHNANEVQRHAWALRAIVLLERTAALRPSRPHEGLYNIARGLHHLGWSDLARPIYERCLEAPAESDVSLRREAAYNLSLIYRKAKAHDLARAVLRKHLTI